MSASAPSLRLRIAGALALAIIAFAWRVFVPWPAVVTGEGLLPPGGADEFYHLRRIEYSVEHFPAVLDEDPTVNFPDGARIVWPPLWDLGIATIAKAAGATGDRERLEWVVAWIPPLLGAVTVFAVFWIAWGRFGTPAAWTSGLLLTFLPAHYLSSRLAKSDHHVGALLAATWLLSAGMRWWDDGHGGDRGPRLARGVELGLAFVTVLLVWTGSLLHVALTVGIASLAILCEPRALRAVAQARSLATGCAVAAIGIAPFVSLDWSEYGDFSALVLSSFQPIFFAAAGVVWATTSWLWSRGDTERTLAARAAIAFGVGAITLVSIAIGVPGFSEALASGSGWFEGAEDFQGHVLELRSMWSPAGSFTIGVAQALFTHQFALMLFAIPWLAWRIARGAERPGGLLLVAWGVAFFGAASLQIRFSNELAIPLALLVGFAIGRLARVHRGAAFAALTASLVVTGLHVYSGPLADHGRVARGERPARLGIDERVAVLVPFARWLGEHSPETEGWLDPAVSPVYGVLTDWGQGHLVRYYARRPMLQDNFGVYGGRENYEAAERYFSARDERAAKRLLEARRIRYVLASPSGSGHSGEYGPMSMARRLALHRGLEASDRGERGPVTVPALVHHRLIHEVDWTIGIDEGGMDALTRAAAAYRWFEVVEGARIRGRAAAGARVEARIRLENASGRSWAYKSTARTSRDGVYELIVPYPTGGVSAAIDSADHYRIASARGQAELTVPDAAILSGATIDGPDLRPQSERTAGARQASP